MNRKKQKQTRDQKIALSKKVGITFNTNNSKYAKKRVLQIQ